MSRLKIALALLTPIALLSGCSNENPAPGNDREAQLDPPPRAAPIASVSEAIGGIEPSLLYPETMTEPDLAALPPQRCLFRFTRVGFPSFAYGGPGSSEAWLKLNGRLVSVQGSPSGEFGAGGMTVEFRPVDDADQDDDMQAADLVVHLPGASVELGYRGFASCDVA